MAVFPGYCIFFFNYNKAIKIYLVFKEEYTNLYIFHSKNYYKNVNPQYKYKI